MIDCKENTHFSLWSFAEWQFDKRAKLRKAVELFLIDTESAKLYSFDKFNVLVDFSEFEILYLCTAYVIKCLDTLSQLADYAVDQSEF